MSGCARPSPASTLALPPRRLVANLAPADLPKEGNHFDLPIALALMAAMGIVPQDALDGWAAIGELNLNGEIAPVAGALPAAVAANAMGLGLICPQARGPEAAWAGDMALLAPRSLIALVNHFRGVQLLSPPKPGPLVEAGPRPDLKDVKGQESAKRALEIAAAGGHNLLYVGPPGSGKSMLAQRLPGLLPPLTPTELLETSMVHSVAGLNRQRGADARAAVPRPASLGQHGRAHRRRLARETGRGLPGAQRSPVPRRIARVRRAGAGSLRQPLETGEVVVARANAHVRYPARVQLVAAMNPCRCGVGGLGRGACGKAPRCLQAYQGRILRPVAGPH